MVERELSPTLPKKLHEREVCVAGRELSPTFRKSLHAEVFGKGTRELSTTCRRFFRANGVCEAGGAGGVGGNFSIISETNYETAAATRARELSSTCIKTVYADEHGTKPRERSAISSKINVRDAEVCMEAREGSTSFLKSLHAEVSGKGKGERSATCPKFVHDNEACGAGGAGRVGGKVEMRRNKELHDKMYGGRNVFPCAPAFGT